MMVHPVTTRWAFLVLGAWVLFAGATFAQESGLRVSPTAIVLDNPEASQQVLVANKTSDLTHQATYEILDPKLATVDAAGMVQPKLDGKTTLVVRHGTGEVRIPVEMSGLQTPARVDFKNQIMPILSKHGCNAGRCHGKAEGRNGFKLSVFGFDPAGDHAALTKESRGRRTFASSPKDSLFLRKATGQIAHGGGRKLMEGSPAYQRLVRWLAEGGEFDAKAPAIVSIEVEPRRPDPHVRRHAAASRHRH